MDRQELLSRQLDREIRARQEAERLLEDKSNELYEARLRAEHAEAALSDALRSLDDGLLLFDPAGKLILANRRFFDIYPQARSICEPGIDEGRLWRQIIAAGAFTSGSRRIGAPGDGKRRRTDRWERITSGGRHICIIEHETEAGQRISIHRDVSDIRIAEAQLHWRLAAIEGAADGISITDEQGIYTYLNEAHARLMKYDSAAGLIGRSWRVLYDAEELERFDREILPQLHARGAWQGTARAVNNYGDTQQQELSLNLLPGRGILCVMRDITEKLKADAEQQRVMQRLFEAERMEAVGQLARVVAHDFSNVLTAISAFVGALEGECASGSKAGALVGKISSAVDHAGEIVERLQGSYINRKVSKSRVDLVRLARDTSEMVRATLPTGQELRLRVSNSDISVQGDHAQLGQMIMNFLVNARDALKGESGLITVTVEELAQRKLDGNGWAYSAKRGRWPSGVDMVCVSVEDSGCGMDEAVIKRAFEPEFSTKNDKTVRGLGLSTAKAVADAHRGVISLCSTPGGGTRAALCLPIYRLNLPEEARILVVDDDPLAGESLTLQLEALGHRSAFLDHPGDAIGVLKDDPQAWDLVITDQQMPYLDGTSLARHLLELRPELPVIICTGLPGSVGALPNNVTTVIKKPVDDRILTAALSN